MFDPVKVKDECVEWIRNFFEESGKGCNAVVGISGGKDSTVCAALCAEALGKDKKYVESVMMSYSTGSLVAYQMLEQRRSGEKPKTIVNNLLVTTRYLDGFRPVLDENYNYKFF